MNKEQVTGKFDQAVGKVKQSVGEAAGDETLSNQGLLDQAKGAVKETWGDAKDAAKQIHQSRDKATAEQSDQTRGKISRSIDNAKDKVKDKIGELKKRHAS